MPDRDASPSTGAAWQSQKERGAGILLKLMVGIARLCGRGVTRLLLFPIVAYFLCTGGTAREASADYLTRVLGRKPGWRDHARHVYAFAACTLDRVFLLGGSHSIEVISQRDAALQALLRERRGFLFICSHLGSFEALRATITADVRTPVRIVMDRLHNPKVTLLLEALNPQLAAQVIDAGDGGPQLVLALREALEGGAMVGLMGDRVREGERFAEVDFLGGRARLPLSPWILAGVLGVPVVFGFSLYRGGRRYENHLEVFADRIELPRARRDEVLQDVAQRYAQRLEHHVRMAPYNWFNWYRYWR